MSEKFKSPYQDFLLEASNRFVVTKNDHVMHCDSTGSVLKTSVITYRPRSFPSSQQLFFFPFLYAEGNHVKRCCTSPSDSPCVSFYSLLLIMHAAATGDAENYSIWTMT